MDLIVSVPGLTYLQTETLQTKKNRHEKVCIENILNETQKQTKYQQYYENP